MKYKGKLRNIAFIKSCLTLLILMLSTKGLLGQKMDQITLMNGNQITGEVKKMEYGKLTYSTDDFGTVSINWEKSSSSPPIKYLKLKRPKVTCT